MKSRVVRYAYYFFGLVCGYFLGTSLGKEGSRLTSKLVPALAIFFIAFFWRRIEAAARRDYLDAWERLRVHGKWYFVITRYVLLRGFVLSVVLLGPFYASMEFSKTTLVVLASTAAILALMLGFLGLEEWTRCSQDFEVLVFKHAAEQSRLQTSAKN